MINSALDAFPSFYQGLTYKTVELYRAELDMDEDGDLVFVFPDDGTQVKLTEYGFESLCTALQVPLRFGRRLREDGKNHILAYLQKQLAQAYAMEPITAVTRGKEVLSFTTENLLPFRGEDAAALDKALVEFCTASTTIMLESRKINGEEVVYDFIVGQQAVTVDPDKSEWKFGHSLHYSLIGKELPYFTAFAIRLADASRMTFPERRFRHKLSRNKKFDTADQAVFDYLKALPDPEWGALNGYVNKLVTVTASMRELKEVRSRLTRTLKADKEDKETTERIEKALCWNEIVLEYGLKGMDPKPSKNWYMKATTPHSLWTLYNVLSRETTHAPNDLAFEKREKLFLYSAKMLDRSPDLAEKAANVSWKGFKIVK